MPWTKFGKNNNSNQELATHIGVPHIYIHMCMAITCKQLHFDMRLTHTSLLTYCTYTDYVCLRRQQNQEDHNQIRTPARTSISERSTRARKKPWLDVH